VTPLVMPALAGLLALLMLGGAAWIVSLFVGKVSFVDSLWPFFFVLGAGIYFVGAESTGARAPLVMLLLIAWALRLALHIGVRNLGAPEDRRYVSLAKAHRPFAIKSLYVVFGLQAVLAWFVSLALLPAVGSESPLNAVDVAAVGLWFGGMFFEVVGDWQLTRFGSDPSNRGKVLDTGLWRYTRHPNYFGEFCIWWAFYLFAVAAGGWWTILSPIVMSILLLRVSGVVLLEKTISKRRPGYAEYAVRTNAFFPGPRKDRRETIGVSK
jgi:steroid 5-alpha reductase family enzyme